MQFGKKDILIIVVSSVLASLTSGLYDMVQEIEKGHDIHQKAIAWFVSLCGIAIVFILYKKSNTEKHCHPRDNDKN